MNAEIFINDIIMYSNLAKTINQSTSKGYSLNILRAEKDYKEIYYTRLGLEGWEKIKNNIRQDFVQLIIQNYELIKLNESLTNKLEIAENELNKLKPKLEKTVHRKERLATRKPLPKRDVMTGEIYKLLIQAIKGSTYTAVRLRIAFCLLTLTGLRINELLPLKVLQINALLTILEKNLKMEFRSGSKKAPADGKTFLTDEGKKVIKERKEDFEILFLKKDMDSYVFTSELSHKKMLSRETITRDVNQPMRSISKRLPNHPNITSHSFRDGYIFQLWKDPNDIEFVIKLISFLKVEST